MTVRTIQNIIDSDHAFFGRRNETLRNEQIAADHASGRTEKNPARHPFTVDISTERPAGTPITGSKAN